MKKVIFAAALSLLLGCDSSKDKNLKRALTFDKSMGELSRAFGEMANISAKNKKQFIAEKMGKDNFTFWLMTSHMADDDLYNLELPSSKQEKAHALAKKFEKDASFITLDDVKNLTYKDLNDGYTLGSFSVKNECITADFLFLADNKQDGKIVKLVIPRKDSNKIDDGLVIFDLKNK
jgi:hypothetical protein